MSTLQLLPILTYIGVIAVVLMIASDTVPTGKSAWLVPTVISALFIAFSLVTVLQEGLIQFWDNHTNNLAGNQVWFDLILAVVIGFFLIAPRARAVGMRLMPWAIAVLATACVALLPMLARVIWLEQKADTRNRTRAAAAPETG